MKKLLAIILSAMFMMGSTVVANAATEQVTDGTATKAVNIKSNAYQAVYRIDVTWDALDFTYDFTTWDAEKVAYTGTAKWNADTKTIKVENRSNADVTVSALFAGTNTTTSNTVDGVSATITSADGNFNLPSADDAGYSSTKLPTKELSVKVSGRPENKADFKLDDIVIKISK